MKRLLLLAFFASPAPWLAAQTGQAVIDRSQQPAPPSLPADQPAGPAVSPGDADTGNQRIAQKRNLPFKLSLAYDVQVYHTANVDLAPSGQPADDAVIVANTLALRADFNSHAIGDGVLTPSAGLTYQRYYHGVGTDDHDNLDFDAYTVPLSLRYRFGDNWEASLGFSASSVYSLEGPPRYHLIYRAYSPSISLRKLVALAPDHIVALGGSLGYSATTADRDSVVFLTPFREDRNDKCELSTDVAYYYLRDKWTVSPYVRLTYSDYLHYQENSLLPAPAPAVDVDRRDLTGSVGLSVTYSLTPWVSARAFTSFDWRESLGDDAFDYGYDNTNVGLGLSLTANF